MGTVRRLKMMKESWSDLAPGQIIAQLNVHPIVSHGGWDHEGVKQALVWANARKLKGTFQLVGVEENKIVYEGMLRDMGGHIWGGNTLVVDFSEFEIPGRYKLRLELKGTEAVFIDS